MENIKYLESGQEVSVIESAGSRFVVAPVLYCDEFGESFMGGEFIVDKVYESVPTEKYSADIEKLNDQIEEKRRILGDIRTEIHSSQKELDSMFKEFGRIPALKNLKSVIDGDFKYFANADDYQGPTISDSVSILDNSGDRYDGDQKLLTLFGRTEGDMFWRINRYSDGSGSSTTVMPCKTEDEAMEYIKNNCLEYLNEIASRKFRPWAGVKKADWLTSNGFELPVGYIEVYSEYRAEADRNRKAKISKEMAEHKKELKEIELREII